MESLLNDIIGWLTEVGPGVVFLVVMTETAFFIGLLVPAEATVLVAAYLAEQGTFELEHVLAATLLGALAGDQIGYALGRFGGRRVTAHGGRLGRLWSRHEARAHTMFNRHSIVAVSLARFISFVRTLMPWFAGMSGVPYLRFAVFDALGVLGWGVASVAAGYLAGPGWRELAGVLGVAGTIVVVALVLGVVIAVVVRRRREAKATSSSPGDPDANDVQRASR